MEFLSPDGGKDGEYNGIGFWKYMKYLQSRTHLSLRQGHLAEYIMWIHDHKKVLL